MSFTRYGQYSKDGYVPSGLGIGGGDYVEFKFCADCGLIQKFEPLTDADILEAMDIELEEEEEVDNEDE